MMCQQVAVALRKESVDRNWYCLGTRVSETLSSLSARRAWIEISRAETAKTSNAVALRKESVDRNKGTLINCNSNFTSLSARRAWIEIAITSEYDKMQGGRSPQGERG